MDIKSNALKAMGIIPIAFKHTYNTKYNPSNIRKKIHHEHIEKSSPRLKS